MASGSVRCPHCKFGINREWHKVQGSSVIPKDTKQLKASFVVVTGSIEHVNYVLVTRYFCERKNLVFTHVQPKRI